MKKFEIEALEWKLKEFNKNPIKNKEYIKLLEEIIQEEKKSMSNSSLRLNKNIAWRIFKVIYWSIAYPLCVISIGYCLGSIIYGIYGLFTEIESTGMECLAISAGSLLCLLPIILLYFIIRRLIIYIVFDK